MDFELIAQLGVLALVDATSVGTLAIPIALLLAPLVRPRTLMIYLATVAGFYFALGLVLLAGGSALLPWLSGLAHQRTFVVVQLVVGIGLFAVSFLFSSKRSARRRERRAADPDARPGPVERMRTTVTAERAPAVAVAGLGLTAALIEAASMVPYLAAIGLLTTTDLVAAERTAILAGYVVVMCLPAIVLTALRFTTRGLIDPVLQRISAWFERNGSEMLGWTLGIVGFLIVRSAVAQLGGLGQIIG